MNVVEKVVRYGTIRKNHTVQATISQKFYTITRINLYGKVYNPGQKEFKDFLVLTPRCVRISERVGDGVEVAVP